MCRLFVCALQASHQNKIDSNFSSVFFGSFHWLDFYWRHLFENVLATSVLPIVLLTLLDLPWSFGFWLVSSYVGLEIILFNGTSGQYWKKENGQGCNKMIFYSAHQFICTVSVFFGCSHAHIIQWGSVFDKNFKCVLSRMN